MVKELQDIALDIFLSTSRSKIQLDMNWIPRDQNFQADFFSKIVDFDDYSVVDEVFFHLEDAVWWENAVDWNAQQAHGGGEKRQNQDFSKNHDDIITPI